MKNLMFFFIVAILVQSVVIAAAPADDQTIHPELSRQMAMSLSNNSEDAIFVIVIMKEQYQPPDIKDRSNKDNKDKKQHRLETVKALKEQSQHSQRDINLALKEKGPDKAKNIQPLWIVNAIGLEATPDVIEELARRDDVAEIIPNFKVHALEEPMDKSTVSALAAPTAWGVEKINAPQVWALGYNGTGINVSVIDTGVNYNHPDLADSYLFGYDYVNADSDPMDDHILGHGTHVAGTIVGNGASGTNTGVAPGAKLLVAKVLDSNGNGDLWDVYWASQWSVNNGADVISMSLGGSHFSLMTLTIKNIVDSGVVPVIAAGNDGPSYYTIDCPGDEENAITVGSTDITDTIASSSSRGPVNWVSGTYIKPDMVAPGVSIESTNYLGGYRLMSGTSMATPHVSGAVALILQANPNLTPLQVRQLLEDTAIDLGTAGKDNVSGSGRIDVFRAISIQAPDIYDVSINPNPTDVNAVLNATITDLFNNISYADFYFDDDSGNLTVFNASDGAFNSRSENVTRIINISSLSDGTYVITIRANDSTNNWNNNTNTNFTVDTTTPTINLTSPANNSYIQNGTIIQFNITDLTLANVTYSINSTQANYTNTTNKTFLPPYEINTSDWNESTYHITIWANDTLGHENISNYQFVIDDTPPNITSVFHNGTGIIDQNHTLWVNLTGDGGNISYFKIAGTTINQSLPNITSNYYSTNYSIPAGIEVNNSNLTGYLIDKAGNVNSSNASTTISIDSLSPRINLTSPANISYIRSGTIINFTISDLFLANVTYSLNSTQANYTNKTNITLPSPYEINTAGWNESSFNLTIWANDSLNHINTSVHNIIVDNTSPNLTITNPTSNYSTTDTTVTITGTTDLDADITVNGVLISSSSGAFSQSYPLTAGYNNFTINATDKAGNVNSTIRKILRYIINSPSNGGGGGGGGSSGEDFNNIAETQTQRNSIFKNDNVSYAFEQTLNPILYVNFTSKISAGTIASKIEVLRNTSSMVNTPAPGVIYKNINIWLGNYGWANDRSITNTNIIFAVTREWITTYNIQEDSITLYRYNNDSWELLPTSMLNTNEQYLYYQSSTPGFSPFAISGEPVPSPASTVVQTPLPTPAKNTSITSVVEIPVEHRQDGWNAPSLALLIFIVLSLIAIIFGKHKQGGSR